jgi:hypothetical protein
MKTLSHRIIHFRFLEHSQDIPVAMREFRALREEITIANVALEGATSLRFPMPELSPYGGYTVVVIKNNETNEEWLGVSKCNSGYWINVNGRDVNEGGDRFVRKVGVSLALGKANLAMSEGIDQVDEIEFYSNSRADNELFFYLRDNELLRDDITDVITLLREQDRKWRNERRQRSVEFAERQAKHVLHLAEQKQRSVQWHKDNE